MAKFYSKEEVDFLKENVDKFGVEICAQKLNRPLQGVINKVNRLGLRINYRCKASQEEIDNLQFKSSFINLNLDFTTAEFPKELAYFIGFLWADGYVNKKSKRIAIEIVEEDGKLLEPIFMKLCTFSIYKRHRKGRKPTVTFFNSNKNVIDTLYILGKYPKSVENHSKVLNFVPEKYHIWFLRGLIDGDGCFYIHDYQRYMAAQFSIAGSVDQDWSALSEKLSKLGLNCEITKVCERLSGNSSHIRCTNVSNIKKFIQILYADKDNIWLPRKYKKALTLLSI